jgi:hypothetical protein
MFVVGLKPCLEFYKTSESGLNSFEGVLQNLYWNKENRKRKEEKKIKK